MSAAVHSVYAKMAHVRIQEGHILCAIVEVGNRVYAVVVPLAYFQFL